MSIFRHRAASLFIVFAAVRCSGQTVPLAGVEPRPIVVDGLDSGELGQLARIEALLSNGEADEAIDLARRLIESHGKELIKITPVVGGRRDFERYIPVHEYCFARLARLSSESPDAFRRFQEQLDPLAERYVKAVTTIDEQSDLRRAVEELSLSRHGDDALLRLGDLALERGDYNQARIWWERIHTSLRFPHNQDSRLAAAADAPLWLPLRSIDVPAESTTVRALLTNQQASQVTGITRFVFPGTDLKIADVRARLALASILEGNLDRARIEIEVLRLLDGDARGRIATREGNLVEILEHILSEARRWPAEAVATDWLTFAGEHSRQRVNPLPLNALSEPLWSVELSRKAMRQELLSVNRVRVAEVSDALLSFHPLIVGNQVVVQAGPSRSDVMAFDLDTGARKFPSSVSPSEDPAPELGRGVLGVPRFTPMATGSRLMIRTGNPLLLSPSGRNQIAMPTRLEALDLRGEGKLLWTIDFRPPAWGPEWVLGAAPVTDGERLYITALRRGPLRLETHIAAIDPQDGQLIWRKLVAAAEPAVSDTFSVMMHGLLTYSQGVLYCNTNHGAIAAVHAESGNVMWLTSYPRTSFQGTDPDRNDLHFYRDLNPCLVYRDLVIVAPTDCNRIFTLDATTGMLLWATRSAAAADVVHLVGVGANNLIASGECLYWFDVYTGKFIGQFPEPFLAPPGFARPSPRGFGRGILAGSHVYWPTDDAILIFGQGVEGSKPEPTGRLPLPANSGGNLIATKDVLIIAGTNHLTAYRVTGNTETSPNGTPR